MPKYQIIDSFWIDEELRIKAILTTQSEYWYVRCNLPGTGQKKQSLKTKSKKQARINGSRFAKEFSLGNVAARKASRITIREAADLRIDRLAVKRDKPHTIASHERVYSVTDKWGKVRGVRFLDQLTETNMEALEDALRVTGVELPQVEIAPGKVRRKHSARPLGHSYVRKIMKTLRGLINFAVQRKLVESDPCPSYELPPDKPDEVEVYSTAELEFIFDDEPSMANVWQFLFHTCLRREEFCWLLRKDVVFDDAGEPIAIRIRKKVCPLTGVAWAPKHGIERIVPLSSTAAAIAKMWMQSQNGPWLFPYQSGSPEQPQRWDGGKLLTRLQSRLREGGISHGVLHTFRHTGASRLANDPEYPMPLSHLQKFLGHKSIVTTQRYLHSNVDDMASALRRINLGGEPRTVTSLIATRDNNMPNKQNGGEMMKKAS